MELPHPLDLAAATEAALAEVERAEVEARDVAAEARRHLHEKQAELAEAIRREAAVLFPSLAQFHLAVSLKNGCKPVTVRNTLQGQFVPGVLASCVETLAAARLTRAAERVPAA